MGADGPLRCSKCKAYVNPFMQFHSYGKAFTCNFCGTVTQVPPEYQENIAPDGRRRDADERPELCRGSVEFVAPASFSVRPFQYLSRGLCTNTWMASPHQGQHTDFKLSK